MRFPPIPEGTPNLLRWAKTRVLKTDTMQGEAMEIWKYEGEMVCMTVGRATVRTAKITDRTFIIAVKQRGFVYCMGGRMIATLNVVNFRSSHRAQIAKKKKRICAKRWFFSPSGGERNSSQYRHCTKYSGSWRAARSLLKFAYRFLSHLPCTSQRKNKSVSTRAEGCLRDSLHRLWTGSKVSLHTHGLLQLSSMKCSSSEPMFGKGMRRSACQWKKSFFFLRWKGGRQFSEWGVWSGFLQKRQFSEELRAIHWTAGLWKLESCCVHPLPENQLLHQESKFCNSLSWPQIISSDNPWPNARATKYLRFLNGLQATTTFITCMARCLHGCLAICLCLLISDMLFVDAHYKRYHQ